MLGQLPEDKHRYTPSEVDKVLSERLRVAGDLEIIGTQQHRDSNEDSPDYESATDEDSLDYESASDDDRSVTTDDGFEIVDEDEAPSQNALDSLPYYTLYKRENSDGSSTCIALLATVVDKKKDERTPSLKDRLDQFHKAAPTIISTLRNDYDNPNDLEKLEVVIPIGAQNWIAGVNVRRHFKTISFAYDINPSTKNFPRSKSITIYDSKNRSMWGDSLDLITNKRIAAAFISGSENKEIDIKSVNMGDQDFWNQTACGAQTVFYSDNLVRGTFEIPYETDISTTKYQTQPKNFILKQMRNEFDNWLFGGIKAADFYFNMTVPINPHAWFYGIKQIGYRHFSSITKKKEYGKNSQFLIWLSSQKETDPRFLASKDCVNYADHLQNRNKKELMEGDVDRIRNSLQEKEIKIGIDYKKVLDPFRLIQAGVDLIEYGLNTIPNLIYRRSSESKSKIGKAAAYLLKFPLKLLSTVVKLPLKIVSFGYQGVMEFSAWRVVGGIQHSIKSYIDKNISEMTSEAEKATAFRTSLRSKLVSYNKGGLFRRGVAADRSNVVKNLVRLIDGQEKPSSAQEGTQTKPDIKTLIIELNRAIKDVTKKDKEIDESVDKYSGPLKGLVNLRHRRTKSRLVKILEDAKKLAYKNCLLEPQINDLLGDEISHLRDRVAIALPRFKKYFESKHKFGARGNKKFLEKIDERLQHLEEFNELLCKNVSQDHSQEYAKHLGEILQGLAWFGASSQSATLQKSCKVSFSGMHENLKLLVEHSQYHSQVTELQAGSGTADIFRALDDGPTSRLSPSLEEGSTPGLSPSQKKRQMKLEKIDEQVAENEEVADALSEEVIDLTKQAAKSTEGAANRGGKAPQIEEFNKDRVSQDPQVDPFEEGYANGNVRGFKR